MAREKDKDLGQVVGEKTIGDICFSYIYCPRDPNNSEETNDCLSLRAEGSNTYQEIFFGRSPKDARVEKANSENAGIFLEHLGELKDLNNIPQNHRARFSLFIDYLEQTHAGTIKEDFSPEDFN